MQQIRQKLFYSSALIAVTLALGACSDIKQKITGERPRDQMAMGARRAPMLNPQAPTPVQNPVLAARPPANMAYDNAFDRYDNAGNEIAPAPSSAAWDNADEAGSGELSSDFFNRMIEKSPPPAQLAAPAAAVSTQERKPLSGNPRYSKDTQEIAPLPPGPQSQVAPAEPEAPVAQIQPVEKAPPAPQAVAEEPSAPAEPAVASGGFFDRLGENLKQPFAKEEAAAKPSMIPAEDANAPYPALASVPETPERLQAVKQEKQEKIENLQGDHLLAQHEKQELDSEPSQLAASPVEIAPPQPIVPPAPPAEILPPVAPAAQAASPEPVLLGHAAQPTPVEPPPVAVVLPVPSEQAAPEMQAAEEMPVATSEPAQAKAPWWEQIPLFKKPAPENKAEAARAISEPQPEEQQALPVLAPQQSLAPVEQASEPLPQDSPQPLLLRSASGELLPSLRTADAPVAPVVAQDAPVEAAAAPVAAASAPGGLPSPQLLQTIKMLPASRYETRIKATQSN
jgi:hypothetical protein